MAALLAYPLVVEPELGLRSQGIVWAFAYAGLVVLMFVCGRGVRSASAQPRLERGRRIDTATRLRWIALAAAPSSLLLGVTTHITTDVTPVPLLWVVPLALYLLTFVIAFGSRTERAARFQGRVAPFAAIAVAALLFLQSELPGLYGTIPHLVAFFLLALGCHIALARTRPEPALLTEFYLWIALGGALGGLFNAIVAPIVFSSVAEYPLAIVAAILLGASGASRKAPLVASVATVSAAAVIALLPAAKGAVSVVRPSRHLRPIRVLPAPRRLPLRRRRRSPARGGNSPEQLRRPDNTSGAKFLRRLPRRGRQCWGDPSLLQRKHGAR
jgi:hypothetical protein